MTAEAEDIDFERGGFSRPLRGGFSRRPQEPNASPVGRMLDQAVGNGGGGGVTAKGSVNISVHGDAKVKAETSGDLFQETTISNYKQMPPTSLSGGGHRLARRVGNPDCLKLSNGFRR